MILKLQVSNESGRRTPEPAIIRETGGTIGRASTCTCVLPDKYVSNLHARVTYRNGVFLIEDLSQNGVFINSPSNRLVRGEPAALNDGDLILIDPYEISVSIETGIETTSSEPAVDPFQSETGELDPLKMLGITPERKSGAANRVQDLPPPPVERQSYRPPDPIPPEPADPAGAGLIPDDWELTGFGKKAAPQPAPPPPPPAPSLDPVESPTPRRGTRPAVTPDASRTPGELSEVLKGAGLPPDLVTPELAQEFGRIIRIIISGVMDVLQARQQIKDEFGMQMTVFRQSRNNPLKFSANVEDALHNLLVKRNAAYLGPVEAFEDAFDDVLHHQMAMLAGMRAGFETMLKGFNPQALQEEFDKHGKGSLISVPAKMRYWDQYKSKFDDMVADTERSFKELFGEEFARAYEEQLEHLKAERRSRRSKP